MSLAVVRSVSTARSLRSPHGAQDFEQEVVDQFLLASLASGTTDGVVAADRVALFEFIRFFARPVWLAEPADADRYLLWLRRDRRLAVSTIRGKSAVLGRFFDFLVHRYQGDIHALFGRVVVQPFDEFNKPSSPSGSQSIRVPPRFDEVAALFDGWRVALPEARKFLPASRDYVAASLWRRLGLRINETVMLDIRDWHPELGEHGKLHVRYGKGSRGRGPKVRIVPAINDAGLLIEWWLNDVRHQFGDDWEDPEAPLFPSERRDKVSGHCTRAGREALRAGLVDAVGVWLPGWAGRLSPHGLRHFCASSLYERGMDIKAIQELLGHEWLSTTTRYIHVHDDHIENSWAAANTRVAARFVDREG